MHVRTPDLLLRCMQHRETPEPVIELADVTVAFGDNLVLDGLDLVIRPRAVTVIVGRSGSGKTVLLKTMLGLVRPTRGIVRLFGRDLAQVSEVELVELRRHLGMVFQNYALFDALSVEDNVEFPLHESFDVPKRDAEKLAREMLRVLGLAGTEALLPEELSGGMMKRVGLARALVGHPELVLFDEPTTGLDPLMVERVDAMIAEARRASAITAVVISHDLASVERLADHVAFLDGGKLLFEGSRDDFFHSDLPPIRRMLDVARVSRSVKLEPPAEAPIIELIDVHKSFGDNHVLRGVSLSIRPHGITVLIGASGSGKSVIAKHLMGLLRPDGGRIVVFGSDLAPLGERELLELRHRFGLVFQHAGLLDWLSVEGNVGFPLREHAIGRAETHRRVSEMLELLELTPLAKRLPGDLSAGERKRVGIARAMVGHPEIVIYDEPTTGQDPVRAFEIDELIQQTQQRFGVTSLVISHDMVSTFRIAHRIAMLYEGRIVAYGTPAELLASADPYVQHFIRAATIG